MNPESKKEDNTKDKRNHNCSSPISVSEVNSALLLLALESNPDGLKREDLGSALNFKAKIPFIVTASTDPIQFGFKVNQDPSSNASALKGAYSIEFIY